MYPRKKLFLFFLFACSLPALSQNNPSDSLLLKLADKADSKTTLYKNRTFKFDSALYFAKRSLTLRKKIGDRIGIAKSLQALGEVYYTRKKYKEATAVFKESIGVAKRAGNLKLELAAYDLLIKNSRKSDNFNDALRYQILIGQINDSILNAINENKSREIIELKASKEREKNEAEKKAEQLQKQIQSLSFNEEQLQQLNLKYIRLAAISLAVMILIIALTLYSRYRIKRKLRREVKTQESEASERLIISKDIREDLGLELAKINTLSQKVFDKPTAQDTKKNIHSIVDISGRLLDNTNDLVWQLNIENTNLSNLISKIREYSTEYMTDLPLDIIFRSPDVVPNVPLKKLAYRNIFMVVKEALHNIVRHARALNVDISLTINGDHITITIKDDGIGYDRTNEFSGTGIQGMKTRLQSIGGLFNITIEEQGTTVRLDIKISQIVKK